jgi:hypothetical protein
VDPDHAFVLTSLVTNGNIFDDDFRASHLTDGGTSVLFENSTSNCPGGWSFSAQVVELAGASVDRGVAATSTGVLTVGGLDAGTLAKSFLLYSWSTSASGTPICDRMVMGEMQDSTTLRFSLGGGNPGCVFGTTTVAWERVELPHGIVQTPQLGMDAGESTVNATLGTAYNNARTVAFAGGQAVGGQGDGQSAYTLSLTEEATARVGLNGGTSLTLQRDAANASAQWRPYVVEFQP